MKISSAYVSDTATAKSSMTCALQIHATIRVHLRSHKLVTFRHLKYLQELGWYNALLCPCAQALRLIQFVALPSQSPQGFTGRGTFLELKVS